jgi:hypothetical protein
MEGMGWDGMGYPVVIQYINIAMECHGRFVGYLPIKDGGSPQLC